MEVLMDRRQRKTREAIFSALIALLANKDFTQITVGEIIAEADISRARANSGRRFMAKPPQ